MALTRTTLTIFCLGLTCLLMGCAEPGDKLLAAAGEGNIAEARRLLEEGAPVDARDDGGSTPLHYAAGKGRAEMAELLISQGADVNAKDAEGFMPIHAAVGVGSAEVVALLMENGADLKVPFRGLTPLEVARRKGSTRIEEILNPSAPEPEAAPSAPSPAPEDGPSPDAGPPSAAEPPSDKEAPVTE